MTKQEFKDFCHDEFNRRGFLKKKSMYYLNGKDLLCGLYLQKSIGDAFYVEYSYFIGDYSNFQKYPNHNEADITRRISVLSKQTINGKNFLSALIEYEKYTISEIKPYFDAVFKNDILPPINEGKKVILERKDYYLEVLFPEEKEIVLRKLDEATE